MRRDNQSSVSEFLLLGLPIQPEQQGTYYALFLGMYLTTVLGNLLIILLIRLDSRLHTPMVSWVLSFAIALLHTLLLARLSFLRSNTLPHFFCDLSALLKLSSSDTTVNQLAILIVGSVVITLPFICILVSYGHIGATILRRPSIKGIYKTFSTCGSHLSVVSLYYGAIIGLYFVPSSGNTNDKDVIVSVLYTLVTPMLNPFIYSLRNRDIKGALRNTLTRATFSV
ncbi:OR1J4-containing [Ictidomys tridecemlineatus]|uniref:G-protein coupled receptors family 1 profile domain-containing protein n=1 Tax=Ictidomys tridecemlineatus TaxID=43179 RepID=I3MYL0_ICTTR|nr:OR1J4-containing [Ictidomys tridecemlineatus]